MKKYFVIGLVIVFALSCAGGDFGAAKKKKAVKPPSAASAPAMVEPAIIPQAAVPIIPAKKGRGMYAEGGLAGGAFLVSVGMERKINDRVAYDGGIGYAIGNAYNIVVLDAARVSWEMKGYSLGLGLNYAMYSQLVSGVLGISGTIPNKNILGIEVFGSAKFRDMNLKLGYSNSLGIRVSAGIDF